MNRPCPCDRCPQPGPFVLGRDCYLCWQFHNDARYHALWSEVPATALRRPPCVHLGDEKGRRLCAGCRGHVELIVYVCRHPAHGETTLDYCRDRCPADHYQPAVPAG